MSSKHHDLLWLACKKRDGDYDPWGKVVRWADDSKSYPDCSGGCKWYYTLEDRGKQHIGMDWGICANVKSHRSGLLTFEHQGCEEFEP